MRRPAKVQSINNVDCAAVIWARARSNRTAERRSPGHAVPPSQARRGEIGALIGPAKSALPSRSGTRKRANAKLNDVLEELVTANRILAREGVVDSFGHVSARHPDNPQRFLLSRARAPERIEVADIIEFTLDGTPIDAGSPRALSRALHPRRGVRGAAGSDGGGAQPFAERDPVQRHQCEAQAAAAHVRQHRPRRAELGHPRQVRRHRAAGRGHGHGPRPRQGDRRAPVRR